MSPREAEEGGRREGRVFVTLPRLLRERLRATLAARVWIDARGQPQRGAEGEVVTEWLMDYARLRGWTGEAEALPPAPDAPPTGEEEDFGFSE